jgi:hypothetical protein
MVDVWKLAAKLAIDASVISLAGATGWKPILL